MRIDFSDGNINIVCKVPGREMKTTIIADCHGTFSINFNPARFIHVIKCAHDFCNHGDKISLGFAGELKVSEVSVGDIKILLTPMRVD